MAGPLVVVQVLNGLQLGVLLFLIAAGLTLVFGVMDFINLAHDVQYMLGVYFAVAFYGLVDNFFVALMLALASALLFGLLLEFLVFRHLYDRDHLDQVIATFGIILFLNHGVRVVWGAAPLSLPVPEFFTGSVMLMSGLVYPVWRLVIIAAGLGIAAGLYVLVTFTKIGMLVRACATNARMVSALGVNIQRLFMIVFGFGTMLAGFAGVMIAPIISVEPGMGRQHPHSRLCRHRHRRCWIDPRRLHRGTLDRTGRYARPLLRHRCFALDDGARAGPHGSAGDCFDAEICADGDRPLRTANRPISGARPLAMTDATLTATAAAPTLRSARDVVLPTVMFVAFALRKADWASYFRCS